MNKEDIKIDISGGDWMEREMLTDLVSGQLHDRGFKNVEAINAHGAKVRCDHINYHSPRTILDTVSEARPDLFDRKITVVPAPRSSVYPSDEGGFPGVTTMVRNEEGSTITDMLMYDNPAKMIERARSIGSEITHVGIRANTFTGATDAVRNALVAAPNAFVTVSISDDLYPHVASHPPRIYFNDPPEKIIDLNDIDVRAIGQRAAEEALRRADEAVSGRYRGLVNDNDLTTDDYGNPLNNDPVHQQVVQMVKNNLINSGGFSELANDIARDVARDASEHSLQNAADHLADARESIEKAKAVRSPRPLPSMGKYVPDDDDMPANGAIVNEAMSKRKAQADKIEHLGEKKYVPPVDRSKKK